MSNEQRAHDIAIATLNLYTTAPENYAPDGKIDLFAKYKEAYAAALTACEKHFPME